MERCALSAVLETEINDNDAIDEKTYEFETRTRRNAPCFARGANLVNSIKRSSFNAKDPKVCACCDCWVFDKVIKKHLWKLEEEQWLLQEDALTTKIELPREIRAMYSIPGRLSHLLLSRRGVDAEYSYFCPTCWHSLKSKRIPGRSLANGFAVGFSVEYTFGTTEQEDELLKPSLAVGRIHHWRSRRGKKTLDGDLYHCCLDVKEIEKVLLPRRVRELPLQVVATGSCIRDHRAVLLEKYKVRPRVLELKLNFLRKHNRYYEGVEVRRDAFVNEECNVIEEVIAENGNETRNTAHSANETEDSTVITSIVVPPDETSASAVITNAAQVYHVRSSNKYVAMHEPDFLEKQFPELFVFGRCGLGEERWTSVSNIHALRILMRQSHGAFMHYSFVLVAASVLYRWLSSRSAMVHVAGRKTMFQAGNLGESDLQQLAAFVESMDNAYRERGERPQAPPNLLWANDFVRDMRVVQRAMPHSSEAALQARKQILAMNVVYGAPVLFLTFSPQQQNDRVMLKLLSHREPWLRDPGVLESLSSPQLQELAWKYPGACALSFRQKLVAFMRNICGVDIDKGKKCREEELRSSILVGGADAWWVTIEEQARGSLHAHILVWYLPVQRLIMQGMHGCIGALETLAGFVNALVSTTVVAPECKASVLQCTECGEDVQPLEQVEEETLCKYRSVPKRFVVADPKILFCRTCRKSWSANAQIAMAYHRVWEQTVQRFEASDALTAAVAQWCRQTDENLISVAFHRALCVGLFDDVLALPRHRDLEWLEIFLRRAAMVKSNTHRPEHGAHCLATKAASASRTCRYLFPIALNGKTTLVRVTNVSALGNLEEFPWVDLQTASCMASGMRLIEIRGPVDAWTPAHVDAVTTGLMCNNNIRMMLSTSVAVYVSKYGTKVKMVETERSRSIPERLQRTYQRNKVDGGVLAPQQAGLRILFAACKATSHHEAVGGSRAAYSLLHGSFFHASCEFVYASLGAAKRWLESEDATGTISKQGVASVSGYFDYVYRPTELESLSWHRYLRRYERCTRQPKGRRLLQFLPEHPRRTGYCKERAAPVTVVWPLTCLPSVCHCHESAEDYEEKRELYGRVALTLFIPHRRLEDFSTLSGGCALRDEESHILWYDLWLGAVAQGFLGDEERDCLNNRQRMLAEGLDRVKVQGLCSEGTQDREENEEGNADGGAPSRNDTSLEPLEGEADEDANMEETVANFTPRGPLGWATADAWVDEDLVKTLGRRLRREHAMSNFRAEEGKDSMRIEQQHVKQAVKDCKSHAVGPVNPPGQATISIRDGIPEAGIIDMPTIVKLLQPPSEAARQELERRGVDALPQRPSITSMAIACSLTTEQQDALALAAMALLSGVGFLPHERPRRIFLSGQGGSGKSEVTKALLHFAARWSLENRVVVTATTGIAASHLPGGGTWQGALSKSAEHRDNTRFRMFWSNISLMIIDEVSMLTDVDYMAIDNRLRHITSREEPFGGISMLLVGDFYQLPPVIRGGAAQALYERNSPWFPENDGLRCLTDCVLLTKNFRASRDPHFAEFLKKCQRGIVTNRELSDGVQFFGSCSLPTTPTFITYSHRARNAMNFAYVDHLCRAQPQTRDWRQRGLLLIECTVKKRGGDPFSDDVQKTLRHYATPKSFHVGSNGPGGKKDYSAFLPIALSEPYICLQNINVEGGLANGSPLRVVDVLFHGEAVWDSDKQIHTIQSDKVEAVLVRPGTGDNLSQYRFSQHLPPGVAAFGTIKKQAIIKIPGAPVWTVSISTFDMCFARTITGHKAQGMSLDNVVVSEMHGAEGWAYVVFSRAKCAQGLCSNVALRTTVFKRREAVDSFYAIMLDTLVDRSRYIAQGALMAED